MSTIKYGDVTPAVMEMAHKNFVRPAIDVLSFCCTPIELLSTDGRDEIIGTATGFFWLHNEQAYLVINWHVVSGRNPFNGEIINRNEYIPSRMKAYGSSIRLEGKMLYIERIPILFTFSEMLKQSLESLLKIDGKPIDLWAMQFPNNMVFRKDPTHTGLFGSEAVTCFINDRNTQRVISQAGGQCFILGYPLRNYTGVMYPVWKRGSIASDLSLGVDGHPMFLIDAATTPGMSGSPIIRRVGTFTADNRDVGAIQEFHAQEFIGVYAGRLQNSELAATNIGYTWYQVLIPDVVKQFESVLAAQVIAAQNT